MACSNGSGSSSGSKPKTFTADLNKPELTQLYNSEVVKVESYKRPMPGAPSIITHTGAVATTSNGDRWLIHKGDGYGKASSTVVTPASNMSDKWTLTGTKETSGQTIGSLMQAGKVNEDYSMINLFGNNCWSSTKGVMNSATKQ